MTTRAASRGFAERPGAAGADVWVGAAPDTRPALRSDVYAARLTIDVTTAMRGRIKVAAFQRGETVANMLRDLFEQEFPEGAARP